LPVGAPAGAPKNPPPGLVEYPAGGGDIVPNNPVNGAIKRAPDCCEEGDTPEPPPVEKKKKKPLIN
jgi:hypothetical protein